MASEPTTDPKFEIGHVLFIDMVGYSQLLINEQSALLDELNRIVRGTNQFREAENEGGLVRLPSGDGMALVFRDSPESPAQCALEIGRALRNHARLQVRMGIHSGPVNEVPDVNQRANLAGAGINLAQRVMDCGDAGHILLSRRVADDLAPYAKWRPYLHDIGECQVKHGVRIQLVSLHNGDVGNSQLPKKLQVADAKATATSADVLKARRRRPPWRVIGALVVLAVVLVVGILLLSRFGSMFTSVTRQRSQPAAYAYRSYENAKWSKIYGTDRLFPAKPTFQKLFGWDRKNLAISGTIWPDQLLLLLQNGEWKVNRLQGTGAISACRFANEKRFIFLRSANRGMADLMAWEGAAYQRLGAVPAGSSLYALAPDVFCGMDERAGYWKYSGNAVQQFEKTARESFVLRDANVVAQIKNVSRLRDEPMPVAQVRDVTVLSSGNALGLWSTTAGNCAVVRYRDGLWYLAEEVSGFALNNVPEKAWFVDEKNFVAIGSDKVARSINGKVDFQAVLVAGQEYPAKEMAAVWGRDLNNYWTADLRGNVFHFDGTQWKLIVRGPDFKARQKFEALWPARDGSLIAVTKDDVFALE
jgi:class 3 adenylate cyclase